MMANDELVPLIYFNRIIRYWWVIILAALLGGVTGFIIHRSRPPVYEAQATFMASIDFNKVDFMHPPTPTPPPYHLTPYDEDISLVMVEVSLVHVEPQVVAFAQQSGIALDANSLDDQSTIERAHAYWYLRFRDPDPAVAQKVVNEWAQLGYADLKAKHDSGAIPAYIYFDLVKLADKPARPTYFQTNVFILAGGIFGLVAGLLLVNLPFLKMAKGH